MEQIAVNDNTPDQREGDKTTNSSDIQFAADSLSLALRSFVPRDELETLVKQSLIENTCLYKIELQTPKETKILEGHKHFLFPDILATVQINIPAALIGPAGSGKSTVGEQVAQSLELKFYLQNGVTGTHELTGYMDAYGKYVGTSFRTAFEHGGIILVDEVDTSEAGALKWLNTALANGYASFPDSSDVVKRHDDFRILIAANTWGNGADRVYVGANQLDASTLDRFVFFNFRYDEKLEHLVSGNVRWSERVQSIRSAAHKEKARIVISPRASINGAKLLSLGWDQRKVEEAVIWKGIDPELKTRIEKHAPYRDINKDVYNNIYGRDKKLTKDEYLAKKKAVA